MFLKKKRTCFSCEMNMLLFTIYRNEDGTLEGSNIRGKPPQCSVVGRDSHPGGNGAEPSSSTDYSS